MTFDIKVDGELQFDAFLHCLHQSWDLLSGKLVPGEGEHKLFSGIYVILSPFRKLKSCVWCVVYSGTVIVILIFNIWLVELWFLGVTKSPSGADTLTSVILTIWDKWQNFFIPRTWFVNAADVLWYLQYYLSGIIMKTSIWIGSVFRFNLL